MSELLQQEIQHLQQQIRISKQAAPQCLQAFVDEAALTQSLTAALWAACQPVLASLNAPFYWLVLGEDAYLYERQHQRLWCLPISVGDFSLFKISDGKSLLIEKPCWQGQAWQLPSVEALVSFAQTPENPMRQGKNARLFHRYDWLTVAGEIDLDDSQPSPRDSDDDYGYCLGMIRITWDALLRLSQQQGGRLIANTPDLTRQLHTHYRPSSNTPNVAAFVQGLRQAPCALVQAQASVAFRALDARSSPLPELEPADLTDPTKGLWELWGTSAEELAALGVRARNPTQDVQAWPVAIDFGTSSTVVAYREGGKKRLLRVGVKDFYSPVQAEHFENPTLLEIVDWQALCTPWQQVAYRPPVRWGDVRASHEALASLRDNENEVGVVASILTRLKHWALHQSDQNLVILQDRARQQEIILPKLTLRNPVKGQALSVSEQDPFDPIELYAYFLGLSINWRQRGIFLQYYMTFPVAYPQVVKDNILASFRRGLQRSLPASLVNQPAFDTFCVQERASEPAAFAVAALPFHGIEPTLEGVSYAVFDFGGGTTDFDFGVYREPTPEEEDQGYEFVFEHFGAAGDKFLGGENLLEHLAYLVFKENEASLRQEQIVITCPLDAEPFLGAEMLIASTQTARTNTQVLIGRLRAFWEEGKQSQQGLVKVKLVKRTGESKHLELAVDYEKLEAYLQKRLYEGAEKFLLAMQQAWLDQAHEPEKVHVLLAGNASRSRYLLPAFARAQENYPALPELILHGPITTQETQPDQVTTKTGVALGLLDLCPGARTLVINHACIQAGGEAPFPYYVGRIKRRYFQPVLKPNTPYQQWQEIGIVIDDHFELVYSRSPLANTGHLPQDANELHFLPLNFYQADRQRVFARALTPDTLEVCSALNREAIEEDHAQARALANLQRLTLHK
ncbi:hypothetical protein SAMN05421831_10691 [Allopseudospirillum japonicum]|uniref:Uncharacterized protein n=1 Tax=Allopseudospirillum japonicum TaxID=64971 RepID=A0A1H6SA75_9GAMM|nr:hypothetical protein [Allopseudospirillum japonicum]SEI64821.1 hypothetical protein SAMN05421831_10691 [Allopseudospirillum japonicum]